MKGDIGFVGFMITADEWQELDMEARATLIAVATRRADPWLPTEMNLAEGSGPMEIEEIADVELESLDSNEAIDALVAEGTMFDDPFAGIEDAPLTRALDRA